jgi:hypothetical protein
LPVGPGPPCKSEGATVTGAGVVVPDEPLDELLDVPSPDDPELPDAPLDDELLPPLDPEEVPAPELLAPPLLAPPGPAAPVPVPPPPLSGPFGSVETPPPHATSDQTSERAAIGPRQ